MSGSFLIWATAQIATLLAIKYQPPYFSHRGHRDHGAA
jgi:hypothetical protein